MCGMTRTGLFGFFLAAAIVAAVHAQAPQQQQQPKVVEVEKLRENLFILKGGGGNTAAFVTGAGVVIIDTKIPGWGQPIIDKVKELTNKPITTIINTHTHYDHVSGNVEFPASVDIVVQENTKANMQRMGPVLGRESVTSGPNIFTEHGGRGLPKMKNMRSPQTPSCFRNIRSRTRPRSAKARIGSIFTTSVAAIPTATRS